MIQPTGRTPEQNPEVLLPIQYNGRLPVPIIEEPMEIQPDGSENSDYNNKTTEEKIKKLKNHQARLTSMSQDVSEQLKANSVISSSKEEKKANANFLKVLNEKINLNDTKLTMLLKRIETLKQENKQFKETMNTRQNKPHQLQHYEAQPSNQLEDPKTAAKPKNRRQISTYDVSPGEGGKDESEEAPPISWAFVASRGFKKKKKTGTRNSPQPEPRNCPQG